MQGRSISPEEYIRSAQYGNFEVVRAYLNQNAGNRKAIDTVYDHQCAMHAAVLAGNEKIITLLVEAGADVNLQVNDLTALQLAAVDGNAAVIKRLLSVPGIKVNAKNHKNECALFLAVKFSHAETVRLLLLAGAEHKSVIKKLDTIVTVSDDIKKLFDAFHDWQKLKKIFAKRHIKIIQNDLDAISGMSVSKFIRLMEILKWLQDIDQLTQDSYQRAFKFVAVNSENKLFSKLVRVEEEVGNKFRCEFDNGYRIFCWDEPPLTLRKLESDDADFRRGYSEYAARSPVSIVKRYKNSSLKSGERAEKTAKREAKYSQMSGCKMAFWSKDDRGHIIVVSDYVRGMSISDWLADGCRFDQLSMNMRFNLLVSLFESMKHLHDKNAVHRNINPDNVMINISGKSMRLIEMDAAGKMGKPHVNDKNRYRDIYSETYGAASDIYSLGYIIAIMFPELFSVDMKVNESISHKYVFPVKQDDLKNLEVAVVLLRDALMHTLPGHRCTVNQALQFCERIVEKLGNEDKIDSSDLCEILKDTINRKHFEVEDGLLGSKRPEHFAKGGDQTGGYAKQLGLNSRASRGSAKGFLTEMRLSGAAKREHEKAILRESSREEREQQEFLQSYFSNKK